MLALYLSSSELRWLTQRGPVVAGLTLPIVAAGFIAVFHFVFTLWKHLERISQDSAA